jgi:hypothetical protein
MSDEKRDLILSQNRTNTHSSSILGSAENSEEDIEGKKPWTSLFVMKLETL